MNRVNPIWAIPIALLLVIGAANAVVMAGSGYGGPCPGAGDRVIVQNGEELEDAIAAAEEGDLIELAPGSYVGQFEVTVDGTQRRPISLCGPRSAILDGGDPTSAYGLHVMADHWVIRGITVSGALKGIVLDGSEHVSIIDVEVHTIGTEAIRIRDLSSDNLVEHSFIHDTGLTEPANGEGIYLGTANSQWCDRLQCHPDTSDRNVVARNVIGPEVRAESVDIKEGSSGGVLRDNTMRGAGMTGADSWVDVKGNGYLIEDNRGELSPNDGIQVHSPVAGWGTGNRIERNVLEVHGPGHGIWIGDSAIDADNLIGCSNVIVDAAGGDSNVPCR